MFPGVWAYVSQIDRPLPSSSQAPSVWYDDVATPQWKPSGKRRAGARVSRPLALIDHLLFTSNETSLRANAPAAASTNRRSAVGEQSPRMEVQPAVDRWDGARAVVLPASLVVTGGRGLTQLG